ncbi:MAG: hypothetical protein MK135_09295 [Polyangiaceae bacterium]|nr:hypothetical protein [Polyangiaceae bacterium]
MDDVVAYSRSSSRLCSGTLSRLAALTEEMSRAGQVEISRPVEFYLPGYEEALELCEAASDVGKCAWVDGGFAVSTLPLSSHEIAHLLFDQTDPLPFLSEANATYFGEEPLAGLKVSVAIQDVLNRRDYQSLGGNWAHYLVESAGYSKWRELFLRTNASTSVREFEQVFTTIYGRTPQATLDEIEELNYRPSPIPWPACRGYGRTLVIDEARTMERSAECAEGEFGFEGESYTTELLGLSRAFDIIEASGDWSIFDCSTGTRLFGDDLESDSPAVTLPKGQYLFETWFDGAQLTIE